jgi:hypothetical protein
MTNQHPIHPPVELVQELWDSLRKAPSVGASAAIAWTEAVTRAAQWGSDQELEACIEWLQHTYPDGTQVDALWSFRRPKPLSLKERAFDALERLTAYNGDTEARSILLDILEALPDD